MSKLQPIATPILKIGDRIQYAFRCVDKEDENKEIIERSIERMITISTEDNLYQGYKPYYEDCNAEVQQDANKANNKDTSASIIEIKKSVFNTYVEQSQYLLFDIEQSNKLLQDT